MAKGIADATTKIYEQLESLSGEERLRAVKAALTMLGEPVNDAAPSGGAAREQSSVPSNGFSDKGSAWLRSNKLDPALLEQIFHVDNGKVTLILGRGIGKSKREQTINTYLLTGLAAFLETGAPGFSDEDARKYCQHLGCYDSPNHSNTVKVFGNRITGSKQAGWTLTAPGLAAAAEAVRHANEGN